MRMHSRLHACFLPCVSFPTLVKPLQLHEYEENVCHTDLFAFEEGDIKAMIFMLLTSISNCRLELTSTLILFFIIIVLKALF